MKKQVSPVKIEANLRKAWILCLSLTPLFASLVIVAEVRQKRHNSTDTSVLPELQPFFLRWFLKAFWVTWGLDHWQAEIILKPRAKCQNSHQPNTPPACWHKHSYCFCPVEPHERVKKTRTMEQPDSTCDAKMVADNLLLQTVTRYCHK